MKSYGQIKGQCKYKSTSEVTHILSCTTMIVKHVAHNLIMKYTSLVKTLFFLK